MTWLRGLAGLALALVAAFAIVYWLGLRLPVEHHAVAAGRVEASQDVVWKLVDDTATHTQWRKGLAKNTLLRGKPGCWAEYYPAMQPTFCTTEEIPKQRKVARLEADPREFSGTWTYTLRPMGPDATEVTVTEDGFVQSPLWRFVGHYLMGEQTNGRQFVTDLQAEALHRR